MNAQEKTKLKEWWSNCPSKQIVRLGGIIATVFTVFCIYELGYGFGKFLAGVIMLVITEENIRTT